MRFCVPRLLPRLLPVLAALSIVTGPLPALAQDTGKAPALDGSPAMRSPSATHALLLGAARAGERIVAVGDHGVVLLSDDGGKRFRQAASVPTRALLTAVSFADARNGWAVGHRGTVLHTSDGGENWTLQRQDLSVDQPLFSVLFRDAQHGVAVGLWSLMLQTDDGGRTWRKTGLPPPPGAAKADRNLFRLFAAPDGALMVAGEQGSVLRSTDHGKSWAWLDTGYRGSLWAGTALRDGTLYVAGMRGTAYRSKDQGAHWEKVPSGTTSSLTDLVAASDGLAGVGLDGSSVRTQGGELRATNRPDRLGMTAVVQASDGHLVMFSDRGVVP
ncbi:WD40/YVTN/BNR-like repeat-containing protein [Cupriavidus pinatubonensis]|uniref:WD40/YVTN/BNR-like repeat-containing protein n=1 Tax=Cupriavidus pinatubonensis TaxID=248026 RepID=UPI0011294152|nr:YCF48-related protein [Cupriavidus pinatubonensis]TPQ37992.1 glycosyl hydrolase [Cupriavidus pinatubonensis]